MITLTNDFARIITLLRKERKISQKKAAIDLGISQALLSHYEKGIRHCSIELLCKFADYYGVSCDYLTGRTNDKNGQMLSSNSIPDSSTESTEPINKGAMITTFNKKILVNSINVLFSMLEDVSDKSLTNEVSNYLDIAVYKMFREIYLANPNNISCFFSVSDYDFKYLGDIVLKKRERYIEGLCKGVPTELSDSIDTDKIPSLSYDEIDNKYPEFRSSLMTLIKSSEKIISAEISK